MTWSSAIAGLRKGERHVVSVLSCPPKALDRWSVIDIGRKFLTGARSDGDAVDLP